MAREALTVRRIQSNEGARLRTAHLTLLTEAPWRQRLRSEAEERTAGDWNERARKGATAGDFATFVALDGDDWMGVVDGVATDAATVDVAAMWVAFDHRRRGVGQALLAAIASWARERGSTRLGLWVNEENGPAVEFFAQGGFETVEALAAKSTPALRQLRMIRRLPMTAPTPPSVAISSAGRNG